MKTTTLPLRNLMNRSPLRAFLLIPLALACFALSPTARAVSPPPDGGYPNQNTAEGQDALFSLTSGFDNTALGFDALFSNTEGNLNTAIGVNALFNNTTGNSNTATGLGALQNNTTGINNIGLGLSAGSALTTGKNNIDIGNTGVAGEANKIRIGTGGVQKATFIAGISGVTVPGGVGVIVG